MGIRQQQKEQRRWSILQVALNLFVRQGYAETTIGQIAKAAGMSTGLLFHYFESKEELYRELVELGAEGTKAPQVRNASGPDDYFSGFLADLFNYAKEEPWVAQMFVLMRRARRIGTPEPVRDAALSVSQIACSADVIRAGQSAGVFRDGEPLQLAEVFWASVQGIMEMWAETPDMQLPDINWIMDILRKR